MVFNANVNQSRRRRQAAVERYCKVCDEHIPKNAETYDDNGFAYCQRCNPFNDAEPDEVDENEIDEDMFF